MTNPQIYGIPLSDILAATGTALLQVKNGRGLTLADMAYALRKSDDQVARYIAGDSEMGFITWNLACEEWPELTERLQESANERRLRAAQRALDLNTPVRRQAEAA